MPINFNKTTFTDGQEPPIDDTFLNNLQDQIESNLKYLDEKQVSSPVKVQKGHQIVSKGSTIINEYQIVLPISYTVGNNSLELFWNGSKLIMTTDTADGHYKEVGVAGQISNKIKMHRTAADGNYTLLEDVVLEAVVTGVSETTTVSEGGA